MLRALAQVIDEFLQQHGAGEDRRDWHEIVFPKRVHELPVSQRSAPDGLSPEYVQLACELNRTIAEADTVKTGADRLLRAVEQIVGTATAHERALAAFLQKP